MPILQLPHQTADYLCPVNGLADIYEWKAGERIPEELLFYARSGFLLISNKKAVPQKMIMLSTCSIGRMQYEIWGRFMGYELHAREGKSFGNTLKDIRALIDRDIPVIVFGLDMYHLTYQEKFYHKMHVPGHIVLMVGYDDDCIYVHDNSKSEIEKISLTDLEAAWGSAYLNVCRKNAYIGIDFTEKPRDSKEILSKAYTEMAEHFLSAPVSFMGARGMKKLILEFPSWGQSFDNIALEEIYRFFIIFTGSVLPGLPKELDESDLSGLDNPHKGTRDKFADALAKYCKEFGNEKWITASKYFTEGGGLIEEITGHFIRDVLNQSYSNAAGYIPLIERLMGSEAKAYSQFLK